MHNGKIIEQSFDFVNERPSTLLFNNINEDDDTVGKPEDPSDEIDKLELELAQIRVEMADIGNGSSPPYHYF